MALLVERELGVGVVLRECGAMVSDDGYLAVDA